MDLEELRPRLPFHRAPDRDQHRRPHLGGEPRRRRRTLRCRTAAETTGVISLRTINIHATCILLSGAGKVFKAPPSAGVLLLGRSGAGKNPDLALRLIARGAKLVSDDRVDLYVDRSRLTARAPALIEGLLEVRGLGIVALPSAAKARVALAVSLDGAKARLPRPEEYKSPFDLSAPVPLIRLAPFEASAPEKIALAAAAFARKLFRESITS